MTSTVKRHVQLPRSSQKGKKPQPEDLKYGEIGINFNHEEPFFSIKNSNDEIVVMPFKDTVWDNGTGQGAIAQKSSNEASKKNIASGPYSNASGVNSHATGEASHTEGNTTIAEGVNSHAEGNATYAKGNNSHAEGNATHAKGDSSHAEGNTTRAEGLNSHAEGSSTFAIGNYSHVEGVGGRAIGKVAHVEGLHMRALYLTEDLPDNSNAIYVVRLPSALPIELDYYKNLYIRDGNQQTIADVISAEFAPTTKFGGNLRVKLNLSRPITTGVKYSSASGPEEVFDGYIKSWKYTICSKTVQKDDAGHAEGAFSIVKGAAGHAEGLTTMANGDYSHAEGAFTVADGISSHAGGHGTVAKNSYETACGIYNKTVSDKQIFSIGIGDSPTDRKNVIAILNDGNIHTDLPKLILNNSLEVKDTVTCTTLTQTSDRNLKKNISDISKYKLSQVKEIQCKSYQPKGENGIKYGVIAQDLEENGLNELVHADEDGNKSVDYTSLLILMVKQLQNEVKELKEQLKNN